MSYQMRGSRVSPVSDSEIFQIAYNLCYELTGKPSRRKYKKFDFLFEELSRYSITIDIVDDEEWSEWTHDLTVGHCQPDTLTISVPLRIYEHACCGDKVALHIIFHELGHLILGHRPGLHFSKSQPTLYEDSEWQADTFADDMLDYFGYEDRGGQMPLDFYM